MSGGSYNYVYRTLIYGEIVEVAKQRNDWRELAEAMSAAGYPEAAAPVAAIVARIDALHAWVMGLEADGLGAVAQAFEWWQSCDSDEDRFREALARYLDGNPKRTGGTIDQATATGAET